MCGIARVYQKQVSTVNRSRDRRRVVRLIAKRFHSPVCHARGRCTAPASVYQESVRRRSQRVRFADLDSFPVD